MRGHQACHQSHRHHQQNHGGERRGIGQIRWERVTIGGIGGDPSQRRLSRFALDRIDVDDQGLIRPEVGWRIRDDDLAIGMGADSLVSDILQYASRPTTRARAAAESR